MTDIPKSPQSPPPPGPDLAPPPVPEVQPQEPKIQTDQPFVLSQTANKSNPFIPQQVVPQGGDQPPADAPVAVSIPPNPMPRRIMTIALILVLLVGLAFGAKFVLGLTKGGGLSGNVTLNYWGLWEDDATLQNILTTYESSHPKVKIIYTKQSPQQYRERLQAAINRGDGPDVFRFHNTWVTMLQGQLAAAPPTLMTSSEFASTFFPVASADLVGGQSIYGMPSEIDGLGLYYNADIFSSAGVQPPVTWEDLLNIVPKLTVMNGTTIVTSAVALGTTGNVEHFSDILATMMLQNGAKLSVPTGTQAEQALTFYRKFANPSDPVYTWNDSMDNSINAFAAGKVAMIFAPSWEAFNVIQQNPKLNFKIVSIPQLPGNTVTWASYWVEGVSSKSKYPQEAWDFVKYITGTDVVTKMYSDESKTRLFGEPYARLDLQQTIAQDPYVGAYIRSAPTAKSFPLASRTYDNGLNDKLIKYLGDAVNAVGSGTSPTEALQTAANGFAQVLGSYGLTVAAPTTTP